jgi:glyoxylase I family protein
MYRSDKDRAANQTPARGVRGVHHLTISVADVERASRFYGGVLGFEVEKPAETAAARWLHVGDTIIVLRAALPGTPESDRFSEYRIGVDHLALAVDSREDLLALLDALAGASIPTRGIQRHPILPAEFVCFRDPDNVQWEFWRDLEQQPRPDPTN